MNFLSEMLTTLDMEIKEEPLFDDLEKEDNLNTVENEEHTEILLKEEYNNPTLQIDIKGTCFNILTVKLFFCF